MRAVRAKAFGITSASDSRRLALGMPPAAGTRASSAAAPKARAIPADDSTEKPDSMVDGAQEPHDLAALQQTKQQRNDGAGANIGDESMTASGGTRGTRSLSKFLGARTPSSSRGASTLRAAMAPPERLRTKTAVWRQQSTNQSPRVRVEDNTSRRYLAECPRMIQTHIPGKLRPQRCP